MRAVVGTVRDQLAASDSWFANAGRAYPTSLEAIDVRQYDKIMVVNVLGVVFSM